MNKLDIFEVKLRQVVYHPIYGNGTISEITYTFIRVIFPNKIGEIYFKTTGNSSEKVKTISELSLVPIKIIEVSNSTN